MMDRSSAVIVKFDPSAKLKVTSVLFLLRVDFPISVPSRSTVTCPSLLQLPNWRVAFPWSQKSVEIAVVDHCWTIHLCLSIVSKRFQQPRCVKTKRSSIGLESRTQPFSSKLLEEVKSVMPNGAQAAEGPKRITLYRIIYPIVILGLNSQWLRIF